MAKLPLYPTPAIKGTGPFCRDLWEGTGVQGQRWENLSTVTLKGGKWEPVDFGSGGPSRLWAAVLGLRRDCDFADCLLLRSRQNKRSPRRLPPLSPE